MILKIKIPNEIYWNYQDEIEEFLDRFSNMNDCEVYIEE